MKKELCFFFFVVVFVVANAACSADAVVVKDPVVATVAVDDEARVAVLNARIAASNAHDWTAWQALHTDDCVRTAPELDAPLTSSKQMRSKIEELVEHFPDYRVGLVRVVGHGDWVAATFSSSGTLTTTGTHFAQTWTAFIRFDGSRIAEFHEHYDQLDVVAQLVAGAQPKAW